MFALTPFGRRLGVNYDPFREFEEMKKSFFGTTSLSEFKTDIRQEGDNYVLEADLPGFRKEDIKIDIEGDYMTIHAGLLHHHVPMAMKRTLGIVSRGGSLLARWMKQHNAENEQREQRNGHGKHKRRAPVDGKGHDHGADDDKGRAQNQTKGQVDARLYLV